MNKSTMLSLGVLTVVALADYNFPSAMPPGGKKPSEVNQIVTIIWDDNAYSGLEMTNYETEPGQPFASHSWVGGKKPWGATAPNTLNLQTGDFGLSWAIGRLVGAELPPAQWAPAVYLTGAKVIKNGIIYEATKRIEMTVTTFDALDPDTVSKDTTITITHWPLVVADTTLYWADLVDYERNAMMQAHDWIKIGIYSPAVTKTNPDGTPLTMTFNMISGLFVPQYMNPSQIGKATDSDNAYMYRVTKYGSWYPNSKDIIEFPHLSVYLNDVNKTIPVVWGREQPIKLKPEDKGNANGEAYGRINDATIMAITLGHEIGNHTLDHMESNSMLPKSYFDAWGGEGFAADHLTDVSYGDTSYTADESVEFGRTLGISWHTAGWELYGGKMLSQRAWAGLIELGEKDLEIELSLKPRRTGGDVSAFRAPRLEVSSGLYYALKDLGYLYDCGLEEGYEYYVDGTNFLWPYTLDNGSPNLTWQRNADAHVSIDSTVAGLWQIPVNTMIVPDSIRSAVFDNYAVMRAADGEILTPEDKDYWVTQSGKVTGFDFNMFILWGMTKDQALQTLKYNLDLRLAGNKAPMQFGAHTDYYSPMYDYATLAADKVYKNALKFNTWQDRIWVLEQFVDYGRSKGVYFLSGEKTIEYVKSMTEQPYEVGSGKKSPSSWTHFKNATLTGSTYTGAISGSSLANVKVTIPKASGTEYPDDGFGWYASAGTFTGMTHLSLTYNTTAPLVVRLVKSDGSFLEVTLSSLKNTVNSGMIPISAFHENQYETNLTKGGVTAHPSVNTADIVAIEFQLLTSAVKEEQHTLSLSNVVAHTGSSVVVPVNPAKTNNLNGLAIHNVTGSALALELPTAGVYTVEIVSLDGRIIKSFKNQNFSQGVHSLALNNLSQGMYMVRVVNRVAQLRKTMKMVVR